MTAFEPGIVVHAEPSQQGDLFPSQARDASPVTVTGQPSLLRGQPGPATGQELLNIPPAIHVLDATARATCGNRTYQYTDQQVLPPARE